MKKYSEEQLLKELRIAEASPKLTTKTTVAAPSRKAASLKENGPVISQDDIVISPFNELSDQAKHELNGIKEKNPSLYRKMINWD